MKVLLACSRRKLLRCEARRQQLFVQLACARRQLCECQRARRRSRATFALASLPLWPRRRGAMRKRSCQSPQIARARVFLVYRRPKRRRRLILFTSASVCKMSSFSVALLVLALAIGAHSQCTDNPLAENCAALKDLCTSSVYKPILTLRCPNVSADAQRRALQRACKRSKSILIQTCNQCNVQITAQDVLDQDDKRNADGNAGCFDLSPK